MALYCGELAMLYLNTSYLTWLTSLYHILSCHALIVAHLMTWSWIKCLFARYSHPVEHFSCLLCLSTCCVMTDLTRITRTSLGIAFYRSVLRASYICTLAVNIYAIHLHHTFALLWPVLNTWTYCTHSTAQHWCPALCPVLSLLLPTAAISTNKNAHEAMFASAYAAKYIAELHRDIRHLLHWTSLVLCVVLYCVVSYYAIFELLTLYIWVYCNALYTKSFVPLFTGYLSLLSLLSLVLLLSCVTMMLHALLSPIATITMDTSALNAYRLLLQILY
jgi:hypothetical protein